MTTDTLPCYELRIGGRAVAPVSGEYFPSENPYTAQNWREVARGGAEDVAKAVEAAPGCSAVSSAAAWAAGRIER